MLHVFLDDSRRCPAGFTLAKNKHECLLLLREYETATLSMDCHLGWNEPSGIEIVKAMIDEGLYATQIYLHSSDHFCRWEMYELLKANKPEQVEVFLFPVPGKLLQEIALAK